METKKEAEYAFYTVPLSIDVILYKNNYIDNLLLSEIRKNAKLSQTPTNKDVITVNASHLKRILNTKFKRDLDKIKGMTSDNLSSAVNSAYFLNNIMENFVNLKTVRITISSKRNFTRIVQTEESRIIGFQYKITTGFVNYPEYMSEDQLHRFNMLMDFLMINKPSDYISAAPFFKIKAKEFLQLTASLEITDPDIVEENIDVLDIMYDLIEAKIEEDDTTLLIKTDF